MPFRRLVVSLAATLLFTTNAHAFLEDLCLPRNSAQPELTWCVNPDCLNPPQPSRTCPQQLADFATIQPGRSMIHADATYFIAQALGYRADVAYWIAAYNEVTDYSQYLPIDQCGGQASAQNSGASFITAQYNGFQRANVNTDGPLDHYIVSFSPSGQGNDVHGAGGVQAVYPLYYPRPGNNVAKYHEGWIANPELLSPDVVGGKSAQGASAADLKTTLVGKIVSGTAYSRAEVYQSGVVTLPLQQTDTIRRLTRMNAALAAYGAETRKRSANPAAFVPFEHMPGNSANPDDRSVCWK